MFPLNYLTVHSYNTAKRCTHDNQFSSVAQSCPTLCNPMGCSTPGFLVNHQLLEPTQTHIHRIGDAIPPSHPLSSPSPPAFNLSQPQGLFRWVISSHQVAKVLEFQLQHQSFQWREHLGQLEMAQNSNMWFEQRGFWNGVLEWLK